MDITMSRVSLASDTCDIYFRYTKVNHLLYTCPLVPFEDGILLDPSLVCIHRCEQNYTFIEEESKKKRTSTPSKREACKRRRKRQEEGSSSQATPCARAPPTPCLRASQTGGPEDPVRTGVNRAHGTPMPTGLTDPVRTGSCVRSLGTPCARAPLTPCTRAPLCMAVGLGPYITVLSLLTPSSLVPIYTPLPPPFRLSKGYDLIYVSFAPCTSS